MIEVFVFIREVLFSCSYSSRVVKPIGNTLCEVYGYNLFRLLLTHSITYLLKSPDRSPLRLILLVISTCYQKYNNTRHSLIKSLNHKLKKLSTLFSSFTSMSFKFARIAFKIVFLDILPYSSSTYSSTKVLVGV